MSFEDRLKTGAIGARIIDTFLRQKGWVPYYPVEGVAHPFDRLVASPDKRNLCIVEVKTKFKREAYDDTGVNRSHFDDYFHITAKYSIPLFLAFVDARIGWVYGNWWHELVKTREADIYAAVGGCDSYPWEQHGIVYFPLAAMRYLAPLSDEERTELCALRVSQWQPNEDDREHR